MRGPNAFATAENELIAKALLIEDDSETTEEIATELADRGFEVEWSANGIEGLDKARSSRPDAMIVDLDHRNFTRSIDLAQPAHMDIHRVRRRNEFIVPDLLQRHNVRGAGFILPTGP